MRPQGHIFRLIHAITNSGPLTLEEVRVHPTCPSIKTSATRRRPQRSRPQPATMFPTIAREGEGIAVCDRHSPSAAPRAYGSNCVVVLPFAVKAICEKSECAVAPCQCFSSAVMSPHHRP